MSTLLPVQLCYVFPDHEVLANLIGTAASPDEAAALAARSGYSTKGEVAVQIAKPNKKGSKAKASDVFVVKVIPEGLPLHTITSGEHFRKARLILGLSQKQLGGVLGVNERTVQRWEAQKPHNTAARAVEWMLLGFRPNDFPKQPYMAQLSKRKETRP